MAEMIERLGSALSARYRIERELGQGGMATVYLAEDLKHHRKVAMKVLKPDLAATLGAERFLREIEVAARLTHPHILTLIDSGEADGFLYYVMPYVEGESLRARLTRQGELPVGDAVRILRDVVDALALAHSHGVVHRDIKPDNVLLMGNHAVVTDFGVAKAVSEATGRQKMTTAGVALGTPAYMAPEQAAADPNVDSRADIYAVGAMAYELLTGRPPFTGLSPQEVLAAHVTQAPDSVAKHRATLSPALAELVMRCLAKKPADRWQTASDLLHQLEVLATPSGGMQPTGAVATVTPTEARRSAVKYLGAAAAAVLILGGAWLGVRALRGPAVGASRPKVVVLPFEASGPSEHAYFADGVAEEIATKLGSLPGLAVVAYTGALRPYTAKPIAEVGRDLGVQFVLLGSVRSTGEAQGGRVRVTPRLVRVSDETQIWAESYDEQIQDVFQIQTNIAQRVAQALNLSFGARERDVLTERPTDNLEAYQYFLRGRDHERRRFSLEESRVSVEMFQRAVDLDPQFADAHAALGRARIWLSWNFGNARELPLGKQAIDRAMQLAPERAQSQFALGEYYYRGIQDYDAALRQFQAAVQLQPSHNLAQQSIGFILSRQGQVEAANREKLKAFELDPLDHALLIDIGQSYAGIADWASATRTFDQAIALAPEQPSGYVEKIILLLHTEADTRGARRVLAEAAARLDTTTALYTTRISVLYLERQYDRLLQVLSPERIPLGDFYSWQARAHRFAGHRDRSVTYADSARAVYEEQLAAGAGALPLTIRSGLEFNTGLMYALAQRRDDALMWGRRALQTLPPSRDAVAGPTRLERLAEIAMLVGDRGQALDHLEEFARNGQRRLNFFPLRLNPVWDPVRNDPRFQRLQKRIS